jgi:hypothetical protein
VQREEFLKIKKGANKLDEKCERIGDNERGGNARHETRELIKM